MIRGIHNVHVLPATSLGIDLESRDLFPPNIWHNCCNVFFRCSGNMQYGTRDDVCLHRTPTPKYHFPLLPQRPEFVVLPTSLGGIKGHSTVYLTLPLWFRQMLLYDMFFLNRFIYTIILWYYTPWMFLLFHQFFHNSKISDSIYTRFYNSDGAG